jgi:hypothetical protein
MPNKSYMKAIVEMKSPIRSKKILKEKLASFSKPFWGRGSRKEFYDSDRMLIITLEKGVCIEFLDRDDNIWELSRNAKGRYNLRKLKSAR